MATSSNNKSVLILGAGFSVGAKIPTQENLFKEIANWANSTIPTNSQKRSWGKFKNFFTPSLGKNVTSYNVEDIFTIFDISQIQKEGFRSHTYREVQNASYSLLSTIRKYLIYAVDNSFNNKLGKHSNYSDLAIKLLDKRHSYGDDIVLKFRKLTPLELRSRKFTDYSSIAVGTTSIVAGTVTMLPLGVILFLVDGVKTEIDRRDFEKRAKKMGLPTPKKIWFIINWNPEDERCYM